MALIVINQTLDECRLAHLKDGVVQTILVERADERSRVGDIHWGKVVRVVPNLGAFLDIGDPVPAFLPNVAPAPGTYLMVQIIKDAHAKKPVTLSATIRLVSAYAVYLPAKDTISASTKINDTQKNELITLAQKTGIKGGIIIRTKAKDNKDKLADSIILLHQTWQTLSNSKKSPRLLLAEPCLPLRFVRDFADTLSQVVVDDPTTHKALLSAGISAHYHTGDPIFDHYGAETVLNSALAKEIRLVSGGYLIVEITETLTLIDVNAGIAHPASANSEAVPAIAHLLKLCHIGGVVAVDFISTKSSSERKQLISDIERLLSDKGVIYYNAKLDLLHLVSRRKCQSLQERLCTPCPNCLGAGYTKSVATCFYALVRALIVHKNRYPKVASICVNAHADVISVLESRRLEVQALLDCALTYQVNADYHLGQWAMS